MEKSDRKVRKDDMDVYLHMGDAVSATDLTGMFATPPQTEDEFENLQELHGMEIPKRKDVQKKTR